MVISGNIVDVINKRIFKGQIRIENGIIVDITENDNTEDVYIIPGLIDSHVHIESSMLTPVEFSRLAIRHGTTGAVSDPHEIANVLGAEGIEFMISNGKQTPFRFYFGAPSCVPATTFETSGSKIGAEEIDKLLASDNIYYLSEMMNFPGVIFGDTEVQAKIRAAKHHNKPVDGHAPGVSGEDLIKYASAGITTDHECTGMEEAEEKIKCGMKIQIREGSAAKNFNSLYGLIDKYPDHVMLCTDDSHPDDLVNGHINSIIKTGIDKGVDLFNILRAATLNPARHYNLDNGLLQKNDPADIVIIDDPERFNVLKTFINGDLVFDNGNVLIEQAESIDLNNFSCNYIKNTEIEVRTEGEKINIIKAFDGELYTVKETVSANEKDGFIVPDTESDILKIVVKNRYVQSQSSVAFIKGFNLNKGAIAGSIAHDSHNIIAVGTNDKDICSAINKIIDNKGGIAVCTGNDIFDLQLNIGGIMTDEDGISVAEKYKLINNKAREMGSELHAPFMTLSFMALLVIPEIKLGDKGLFDGKDFRFISLFVE